MTNVLEFPTTNARRFDIALFVTHPSKTPEDITGVLELEAQFTQAAGNPRMTPDGKRLTGKYQDTRWRYCIRYSVPHQQFSDSISAFLDRLESHRMFFGSLIETGGQANLVVSFLGDGHHSDTISRDTLARIVEIGLDFGIEVYSIPQS